MKFILGKKLKMSQVWKGEQIVPVTEIQAGPVKVTQVKTKEKDGYEATQVGYGERKIKNIKKPQRGHFKDTGNFSVSKECRGMNEVKTGDTLDVSQFQEGDRVSVSGTEKGRGFQGTVKRHGFHGGPKSHGQKNRHRAPGSIGATAPQRVMKGRKMAGHMGGTRVTIKNIEVVEIDKDKNILKVKGAVPGSTGGLLEIRG